MASAPLYRMNHPRDGVIYEIAIERLDAGLRGRWTCRACGQTDGPGMLCESIPAALAKVKGHLAAHHAQHLDGRLPSP